MFENIMKFLKKFNKKVEKTPNNSKDAAKERLHLVLMQDRANVSVDFLELMKQEIIDVIKKYIDVDESAIDVRLTNQENEDGTNGAPALYANIPIMNIKNETRKIETKIENDKQNEQKDNEEKEDNKKEENVEQDNKETEEKNSNESDEIEENKEEINKENSKEENTKEEIKSEN